MNESLIHTTSLGPLSSLDTGIFLSGTPWAHVSQNNGSSLVVLGSKGMSESVSGLGAATDESFDTIYVIYIDHRSFGVTCIAGSRLSSNLYYMIFIAYTRSLPLLISCLAFLVIVPASDELAVEALFRDDPLGSHSNWDWEGSWIAGLSNRVGTALGSAFDASGCPSVLPTRSQIQSSCFQNAGYTKHCSSGPLQFALVLWTFLIHFWRNSGSLGNLNRLTPCWNS